MITFKKHSDLHKLDRNDPAYPVVKELIELLIDDFPEPLKCIFQVPNSYLN